MEILKDYSLGLWNFTTRFDHDNTFIVYTNVRTISRLEDFDTRVLVTTQIPVASKIALKLLVFENAMVENA